MDVFDTESCQLQREVLVLRRRLERLVALLRLMVVLVKVSGFSLAHVRLPDGGRRVALLRAIDRSRSVLPLRIALGLLRLPHSAFRGQTPDEMYFGTGDLVTDELDAKKVAARQAKMETNRRAACGVCEPFATALAANGN